MVGHQTLTLIVMVRFHLLLPNAAVAKLVERNGLKIRGSLIVWVRLPSAAPCIGYSLPCNSIPPLFNERDENWSHLSHFLSNICYFMQESIFFIFCNFSIIKTFIDRKLNRSKFRILLL